MERKEKIIINGEGRWPLPDGWKWTILGEIANPERNRVRPQDYTDLPFIGMDDVESETMRLLGTKSSSEMKSLSEHFWPDDVLYGSLRPYLNKVYRPDFEGLCSAEFIVFRSVPHLLSKYLQFFLNQWSFVAFINRQNTGDRPRVKFAQMADYPFPLPPLAEQECIVAEIEKQFTRLDQAVAALRRLQSHLARYKASVLKAACEGRLVPQDPNDEPAAHLLSRILAERRAQWQAANPGKKYREPQGVDTAGLPELPEGWVWVTVDQITRNIQYGHTESAREQPVGPKFLRITDIQNGKVDWDSVPYCVCTPQEHEKYRLSPGDIVFARTGATTGKSFLIKQCPDAVFASYLIRLQVVGIFDERYLAWFFDSPLYWAQITSVKKGSAQPGVNASILATLTLPMPPLPEQQRIVAEVERRLSVLAAAEQAIQTSLARAERLRQSILHRAFTGRLVPPQPEAIPSPSP